MTRLSLTLVVCVLAAASEAASNVCESKFNDRLLLFNGQTVDVALPCKYWALKRHICGDWMITLSPGYKWYGERYRLNTLWLGVQNKSDSSIFWEGRTTNKVAVKFLNNNGQGRELFNWKNGSATSSLFENGIDKYGPYMTDKNGNFKIHFAPWDFRKANEPKYRHSTFKFTCLSSDMEYPPYPQQMCGNTTRNVIQDRGWYELNNAGFGAGRDLKERMAMYYDVLTNEEIEQTDEMCIEAVQTLKYNCSTEERILETLRTCERILGSTKHTQCVTLYSCHPMEIFNACLRWGCSGATAFDKNEKDLCYDVAEATDMCNPFTTVLANLTGLIQDANCYKDFLPILKK